MLFGCQAGLQKWLTTKVRTSVVELVSMARYRHIPVIWIKADPVTWSESASTISVSADSDFEGDFLALQHEGDLVLETRHTSAFQETKLESWLSKHRFTSLIIDGVFVNNQSLVATSVHCRQLNLRASVVARSIGDVISAAEQEAIDLVSSIGCDVYTGNNALFQTLDTFGEGDSRIVFDALSPHDIEDISFQAIKEEVTWCIMRNRGAQVPRLIAIQGEVDEQGQKPLYRHPADEQPELVPFTPLVKRLRDHLSTLLGQHFNHVLIQYYRNGHDNIGEHSDKTLDIELGTNIVNYSLGATRTMLLKKKKQKSQSDASLASTDASAVDHSSVSHNPGSDSSSTPPTVVESSLLTSNDSSGALLPSPQPHNIYTYEHIVMRHNSVFVLGWRTNQRWLHSIRSDKRPESERIFEDETLCDGGRISFTFRSIATFISADNRVITGQGAPKQKISAAADDDSMEMLKAFSRENHMSDYTWVELYGQGFGALNFKIINEREGVA